MFNYHNSNKKEHFSYVYLQESELRSSKGLNSIKPFSTIFFYINPKDLGLFLFIILWLCWDLQCRLTNYYKPCLNS